jgi:hypothetical protein
MTHTRYLNHNAILNTAVDYLKKRNITINGDPCSRDDLSIESGATRHGDVDLSKVSTLSLWPQYLEYLRSQTVIPEITILVSDDNDVVDD